MAQEIADGLGDPSVVRWARSSVASRAFCIKPTGSGPAEVRAGVHWGGGLGDVVVARDELRLRSSAGSDVGATTCLRLYPHYERIAPGRR